MMIYDDDDEKDDDYDDDDVDDPHTSPNPKRFQYHLEAIAGGIGAPCAH